MISYQIPKLKRHLKGEKNGFKEPQTVVLKVFKFLAKLFFTICVSVVSFQRSFLRLKFIKNCLRSTMGQSRVSDFSIFLINSDLKKEVDFIEVTKKFAT